MLKRYLFFLFLFIGPNSSGKSNFLKGTSLFSSGVIQNYALGW